MDIFPKSDSASVNAVMRNQDHKSISCVQSSEYRLRINVNY